MYVHEVLVNRLGGLSLPRKSVGRLTETIYVYRGRKTTTQQHNPHPRQKSTKRQSNKHIGVGGGGARGGARPPPNNLRGGANIPFGPPNNPPTFFFNFYVKQENMINVPS